MNILSLNRIDISSVKFHSCASFVVRFKADQVRLSEVYSVFHQYQHVKAKYEQFFHKFYILATPCIYSPQTTTNLHSTFHQWPKTKLILLKLFLKKIVLKSETVHNKDVEEFCRTLPVAISRNALGNFWCDLDPDLTLRSTGKN